MCYFITIAIPTKCVDKLPAEVLRHQSQAPIKNQSVLDQLPSGYQTFLYPSGGLACACGLYIPEPVRSWSEERELRRKKYAKKGWSKAKIERALAQAGSAHAHQDRLPGYDQSVISMLTELSSAIPRFAVLVHWYNGDVETEEMSGLSTREIRITELEDAKPAEDQLLWISNP